MEAEKREICGTAQKKDGLVELWQRSIVYLMFPPAANMTGWKKDRTWKETGEEQQLPGEKATDMTPRQKWIVILWCFLYVMCCCATPSALWKYVGTCTCNNTDFSTSPLCNPSSSNWMYYKLTGGLMHAIYIILLLHMSGVCLHDMLHHLASKSV